MMLNHTDLNQHDWRMLYMYVELGATIFAKLKVKPADCDFLTEDGLRNAGH